MPLIGEQLQRSVEVVRDPPKVTVDTLRATVTISVQPPEPLNVWWIVMDRIERPSRTKPTKSERLQKNGVRATFRHPHAAHEFLVTLSDESEYCVRVAPHGTIAGLEREITAPEGATHPGQRLDRLSVSRPFSRDQSP